MRIPSAQLVKQSEPDMLASCIGTREMHLISTTVKLMCVVSSKRKAQMMIIIATQCQV